VANTVYHCATWHIELAIAMEADLADAGVAFGDGTAVAAGMAAYAARVDSLPEIALADIAREAPGEGGHRSLSEKHWSRKTDNSQSPEA